MVIDVGNGQSWEKYREPPMCTRTVQWGREARSQIVAPSSRILMSHKSRIGSRVFVALLACFSFPSLLHTRLSICLP